MSPSSDPRHPIPSGARRRFWSNHVFQSRRSSKRSSTIQVSLYFLNISRRTLKHTSSRHQAHRFQNEFEWRNHTVLVATRHQQSSKNVSREFFWIDKYLATNGRLRVPLLVDRCSNICYKSLVSLAFNHLDECTVPELLGIKRQHQRTKVIVPWSTKMSV